MAKAKTKKTERDLAERLHSLGLRRRVAKNIAQATANVTDQLPGSGHTLKDVISKFEDIKPRGAAKKRSSPETATGPREKAETAATKGKKAAKKKGKKAAKKAKKTAAKHR